MSDESSDIQVINLSDNEDSSDEVLPPMTKLLNYRKSDVNNAGSHLKTARIIPTHTISDSESENEIQEKRASACERSHSPDFNFAREIDEPMCPVTSAVYNDDLHDPEPISEAPVYNDLSDPEFIPEAPKRIKLSKSKKVADPKKKEDEKQKKLIERENKKREIELTKALRVVQKEIKNTTKPESMKVIIDSNIMSENDSQDLLTSLQEQGANCVVGTNPYEYSVMWYRPFIDVSIEDQQIVREEREELSTMLVMFVPNHSFVQMVRASVQSNKGKNVSEQTLIDHVMKCKEMSNMDITYIIVGLDKYLRDNKASSGDSGKRNTVKVTKPEIEQATMEIQLQACINFKFLNTMSEFGQLVFHYTKALAEAPFKQQKTLQKDKAFSWYADGDSSCPAKVDKNGKGAINLWRQQIEQFQNVGKEMAEAIVSKYPSPQLLLQAYKKCPSPEAAEKLLQDIVVRRDYGPLETQKRIGPELSYKIHLFFTSNDANRLLRR